MSEEVAKEQPDLLTVESSAQMPCYFLGLTLKNVRSFSLPQFLDLSDGQGHPIQWTIMLGDNGSGKTTLLQSLAAMVPRTIQRASGTDEKNKHYPYVPDILLSYPRKEEYRTFVTGWRCRDEYIRSHDVWCKTGLKRRQFSQAQRVGWPRGQGGSADGYPVVIENFLFMAMEQQGVLVSLLFRRPGGVTRVLLFSTRIVPFLTRKNGCCKRTMRLRRAKIPRQTKGFDASKRYLSGYYRMSVN